MSNLRIPLSDNGSPQQGGGSPGWVGVPETPVISAGFASPNASPESPNISPAQQQQQQQQQAQAAAVALPRPPPGWSQCPYSVRLEPMPAAAEWQVAGVLRSFGEVYSVQNFGSYTIVRFSGAAAAAAALDCAELSFFGQRVAILHAYARHADLYPGYCTAADSSVDVFRQQQQQFQGGVAPQPMPQPRGSINSNCGASVAGDPRNSAPAGKTPGDWVCGHCGNINCALAFAELSATIYTCTCVCVCACVRAACIACMARIGTFASHPRSLRAGLALPVPRWSGIAEAQ